MTIVANEEVKTLVEAPEQSPLMLKLQDQEHVVALKEQIDLGQTLSIINLGSGAQDELSEFVGTELSSVKADSICDQMESLGGVIDEIKSVDLTSGDKGSFLSRLPIIGDRISHSFDQVSMSFDNANERVDRVVDGIKHEMTVIDDSVQTIDELNVKFLDLIDNLEQYIVAGELKIAEELRDTYPVLKAKAEETGDVRDIEAFNSFQSQLVRLNKRVTDMMTYRHVTTESIPAIRALGTNFLQFKEEFSEVINTVIPMWKQQFLLAIEQKKQGKMLKISKSVKDFTNKQYIDFKEQMLELEQDVNATLSRGMIDPAVLKQATDLTCAAIEEHKKRLELTYSRQEETKQAINDGQEKLKKALLAEISK
ncbi:conserved hypothetical protein [Vibrio chagasii]|nr:conserved hypothetical protein [Vibrio chagasii]